MMALVLDTRLTAGGDPVDVVNAAFSNTEVPQLVQVDASGPDVWHRLHSWDLGRGTHVQRFEGTGLRVSRRTKHLRLAAPERIALSIQYENPAWFATGRDSGHAIDPGQLHLVDQTSCHDFQWRGFAGAKAFVVDYDRLELSVDLCPKAAIHLEASPVYDLVRSHIRNLCEDGPELVPGPARDMVGEATVELLRALITTAVDDAGQGAALDDTLQVRIRQYIDEHLTEPTLNAEQIARAHNISVRQLYNIWPANEASLSQWIIAARLEGARRELALLHGQRTSMAALAHRWGFADSAHFSRRFRAAYAMSPREWRRHGSTQTRGWR